MDTQAVKVKALNWRGLGNGTAWAVTATGLSYHATPKGWMHRNGTLTAEDGLEAAKSGAQADYELRILSALEPVSDPRLAMAREALTAARETIEQLVTARGSECEGTAAEWCADIDATLTALEKPDV